MRACRGHAPKGVGTGGGSRPPRVRLPAWLRVAALAGGVQLATASASAGEPPRTEYTLGVFPYLSAATLEDVFAPIASQLGRTIGRPVHLATTLNYDAFGVKLRAGEYEIAYVQPFDYVAYAAPAGYVPVAASRNVIRAAIFVRDDSPIREAMDLRGKTLGLPARKAAVTYLARQELLLLGLAPGRDLVLRHFNSHQSCLQQARIGNVDACGTAHEIVRMFERQMKTRFRAIRELPPIPPSVFVVRGDVPERERLAIRTTLVSGDLPGIPSEARDLFGGEVVQGRTRYFRDVDDREYDVIRAYLRRLGENP